MASTDQELQQVKSQVERLRQQIHQLYERMHYEDLEHAGLGLEIVEHAIEETLEHTGLGGQIPRQPDAAAHQHVERWLTQVQELRREAQAFLASHPNEDLETALKALAIAQGSLHEVAEHYE
jgi:prefoldin subunit 5